MIHQVSVLTLKRTPTRYDRCCELLAGLNFPSDKIRKFEGLDNVDFAKTRDLVEFAIEDRGYDYLGVLLEKNIHNSTPISYMAQTISYLDILTEVAEGHENVLFMHDDRRFNRTFAEIEKMIVEQLPADYHVISVPLDHYFDPDNEFVSSWVENVQVDSYSDAFFKGFQVASDNFIVSPEGALELLQGFISELGNFECVYFEEYLRKAIPKGLYSNQPYFSFKPNSVCLFHHDDSASLVHNSSDSKNFTGYTRAVVETKDEILVDEVIVLTLERTSHRYEACREKLLEMGVPDPFIVRWDGLDSANFEKNHKLVEYAIDYLGFHFMKVMLTETNLHNYINISGLAQSIMYLEVLRYSIGTGRTLFVIHDDRMLNRNYNDLLSVIQDEVPRDFHAISLPIDYYFGKEQAKWEDWLKTSLFRDHSENLHAGFQTCSDNFIVSPLGAADMFSKFGKAFLGNTSFHYLETYLGQNIPKGLFSNAPYFSFKPEFMMLLDGCEGLQFPSSIHHLEEEGRSTRFLRTLEETTE